ncbi:MAG: M20/M25/M40 family metallo-hydrolase [Candidatus Cloacimonetes bacterium]|nr:M20/M25/M40 family metallo-hydrolase [Candidatus Cloacimonadota bacterium]MCF7814915.1 M20/M25/M40 family metallo-hydrolase [Candidatus Cloacimonadota bacterium]MCF7868097.1 M20/M25/M40 family metallo-hydrolase [Candidatus Cloacimonadota bacterium]MCF7883563.1 M20/M25/M40 family metallo-hydrolase [Candidatus Cloacimonadota bacterium]
MKKIVMALIFCFFVLQLTATDLILIDTDNATKAKSYFERDDIIVNYKHDDFLIGTSENRNAFDCELITSNAWERGMDYFLLWLDEGNNSDYILEIDQFADIMMLRDDFMIIRAAEEYRNRVVPIIHNGVVRINNIEVKLPNENKLLRNTRWEEDPFVTQLLTEVDDVELNNTIQTLEDFGTRNWYEPTSIDAQNWLYNKFESYGLSVETQAIPYGGPNSSQNVIATKVGTLYPDEYVILGAHYDSYSYYGDAPGADDNATGSAGIVEIARILSQHDFKRTIVFCTFSGEEYGLYGSEEYASQAEANDMEILGYFNIDMSGYLENGEYIHTDMIAPQSAQPLVDFYEAICGVYLPDFPIEPGMLTGGDSDHTSFNNHGYMGIFPFEDSDLHSPYIHTPNDLNGSSVNNYDQVVTFTQATMASVMTMANMLLPPDNLNAIAGDEMVTLFWDDVADADEYYIYRDDEIDPIGTSAYTSYVDFGLTNGQEYTYYVTAVYTASGEESVPSNSVTVIPMPPISLPFNDDFESGAPYWTFEGSWGLADNQAFSGTYSLTESPVGNYLSNLDISAELISVDLTGFSDAEVSFWAKYNIEPNYDYMYLEVSTDGQTWDELAELTGNQNDWMEYSYSLAQYLNEPNVQIRFRFYSDSYIMLGGMNIDDFAISVDGGSYSDDPIMKIVSLDNYPNPFNPSTTILFNITSDLAAKAELSIFNIKGQKIRNFEFDQLSAGEHSVVWNGKDDNDQQVSSGIYLYQLKSEGFQLNRKMILLK